jgi:hypothetical protein
MKKIFSLVGMLTCFLAVMQAGVVSYTADNSTIFPNPERGFLTMLEGKVSKSSPYAVKGDENSIDRHKAKDNISLVLVLYYLDNFKTKSTLPEEVLNGFDEDMEVLREKGLKAIIRFAYTNTTVKKNNVETAEDASLEIVKSHISQYKSHWQANADVIYAFQAGFIGAWGEWYYTNHFGNAVSEMNDSRRELVDELLAAVPQDRCVLLRTPLFKTGYIGNTEPLDKDEAYTGTPKARLGHHNDAFLYGASNMGTYRDTAKQKPYIAQETLYVPIGGETDIEDAEQAATDASHDATVAEMSRLHWTFIQSGYSEVVTNRWREEGTFDELNRFMGYRYQLVSGTYSNEVAQGGKLSVNMQIRNAGYAPLYNERPTYIVLKNGASSFTLRLDSDPRTWLPNGVITTVNEQLTVPNSVPQGTYDLYLYMPDAYESLASDPRYAVRFANDDVWDAETGMNDLHASVTVTGSQIPPEPPVEGDAVLLPATLNKSNVSAYSDDMTWYNGTYFDFGPEDAENVSRWADWKVELRYPGEYIVIAQGYYPNGHQWLLSLLESAAEPYALAATWEDGEVTETGETLWNLNAVEAGVYTLRVQNIMEWGQPKLKNITLQYNGEIPTASITVNSEDASKNSAVKRIENGQLILLLPDGRRYNANGQMTNK